MMERTAVEHGFRDFYRREFPAMVALATAVMGDASKGEDVAQEALTRAYRRWETVSEYDKPGAWLRRVTINLSLSARKRAADEVRARLRLRSVEVEEPDPHDEVWEALAKLPGKQRAAVALHFLEDRSHAEIAEILGCAEATSRVHLHRGRAAMVELLGGGR